jgi:hypothetical protein
MRGAWGLALAALLAGYGTVSAQGVCVCCDGAATQACRPACAAAQAEAGFCRPAMIFAGDAGTPAGTNPLLAPSLKYLSLGEASAGDLESVRQYLELWRRRSEAAFGAATDNFRAGAITRSAFDEARTRFEAELVNYQHGMRAYRAALARVAGE